MRSFRKRSGVGAREGGAVMKKGPWSPWEDELLVEYVSKHGERSWKEVAQRSGLRRCGKSCRLRWTNQLRPHLRRDRFTPEEEATILLLHSIHGNKWAKISAQLPGRTDNAIKNFMNTRVKRQRRQGATAACNQSTVTASTSTSKSAPSASSSSATSRTHFMPWFSPSHSNNTLPSQGPNHAYASTSRWSWALRRSSTAISPGFEATSLNFPHVSAITRVACTAITALQNEANTAVADSNLVQVYHHSTGAGGELAGDQLGSLPWLSQESPNYGCKLITSQASFQQPEVNVDPLYRSSVAFSDRGPSKLRPAVCVPIHGLPVQLPELPSVQHCSSTISYSDPLAFLGGDSLSLFKEDDHNLNFSSSTPLVASLNTSTLESDSDYTLECIIKPLSAWRKLPGPA